MRSNNIQSNINNTRSTTMKKPSFLSKQQKEQEEEDITTATASTAFDARVSLSEWNTTSSTSTNLSSEMMDRSPILKQSNKTKKPSTEKKVVTFASMIQFRDYPIIVGDSPAVKSGVPIAIGWEYLPQYELPLDEFEGFRSDKRRLKIELQLESLDRVLLLKSLGYTVEEIREGIRIANVGRMRRQRTRELLHFAKIQETIERTKRAILNATIRHSQKRQERATLNKYRILQHTSKDESIQTQATTPDSPCNSRHSCIHVEYAKGKFLKVD